MKHALLAASLVLVASAAVGCGGDGGGGAEEPESTGAPANASAEDFCQNFNDFQAALVKLGQDAEDADFIKALKEAGGTFEDTGTPEDIGDSERAGFEVFVQLIEDVDENASQEELSKLEQDLSSEEQEDLEAFTTYVGKTCAPTP
jgi:hypothetical protein